MSLIPLAVLCSLLLLIDCIAEGYVYAEMWQHSIVWLILLIPGTFPPALGPELIVALLQLACQLTQFFV